ncbi:archease [Micromonospora mangrovi]|uniref:Archease n=2 Tax=Micromonospora TaxID=1873 RepID=A0AAU8HKI7_9ACTN
MGSAAARGHHRVPHTADVRIEAWAPDRESCLAEAVTALVESFVDPAGATPDADAEFHLPPQDDPDLLVGVLDEVIFRLETSGVLPLATRIRATDDGGVTVHWRTVPTEAVELVGAVPKAVSLHELRFGPTDGGWAGAVTLDV